MMSVTVQTAKAELKLTAQQNDENFQKFRTECSEELGIDKNTIRFPEMEKCNNALEKVDPSIQKLVHDYNTVKEQLDDRINAIKSGKCHLNEKTIITCPSLGDK